VIGSLQEEQAEFLQLDLGNTFCSKEGVADFKTRCLWSTMEDLGVHATTLGRSEIEQFTLFRELSRTSPIQVVSTNLLELGTTDETNAGTPVGQPFALFEIGKTQIGLIALLGVREFNLCKPPDTVRLQCQDPKTAAEAVLPELRQKADLIVLLSQMSTEETDRFLEEVDGIDVALYGQRASYEEEAKRQGDTIVNQVGQKGQYLGKLILSLDRESRLDGFRSENAPLDTKFGEDKAVATRVEACETQAKALLAEYRKKKQAEFEALFGQ